MRKIISLFISILMILTLVGCDFGGCKNCNLEGTPFPTLEPESWPSEYTE